MKETVSGTVTRKPLLGKKGGELNNNEHGMQVSCKSDKTRAEETEQTCANRCEQAKDVKREEARELKKTLEKLTLTFKVKTGDNDKVFGSVSLKQIKDELKKKNYNFEKQQIRLLDSLSSLGFHNIEITIYKDITAKIKVHLIK